MKRSIFITIFVLSFSLGSFAQTNESVSPENCHLDSFGRIDKSRLFARLEQLMAELEANSTAEAVIDIEFDKKDCRKKKVALLQMFNQYFNFRKVDRTRFTFVISESNSELTTLKIFFNLDTSETNPFSNDKLLIKGENLRQAINTIFKKN